MLERPWPQVHQGCRMLAGSVLSHEGWSRCTYMGPGLGGAQGRVNGEITGASLAVPSLHS